MSHLDEGTLHALLDGELDTTEVAEIQAHLGTCAACGSRLREVREVLREADRLVGVMELPRTSGRHAAQQEPTAVPLRDRGSRLEGDDPAWDTPPVLLIPDNPDPSEWRRRFLRGMSVAATIAIAVGAGYIATESRKGSADVTSEMKQKPAATPVDHAVVSSEETARPDSGSPAQRSANSSPSSPAPASAARTRKPSTPPASTLSKSRTSTLADKRRGELAREPKAAAPAAAPKDSELASQVDSVAPADSEAQQLAAPDEFDDTTPLATEGAVQENVRKEAARATAELDQERLRRRAAEATAALEAQKQRDRELQVRAAAQPAGGAAPLVTQPAVRTPEQRAQIYLRIGLDEGARQLGGPVHVIEGMSPLFMGLVQGRLSSGADPARPVVRVVYQDAQGRLIFLDQQQIRGSATPSGGAWAVGETMLSLHGEVSAEILKTLRPRVR
jgi:hypothetical protein